MAPFGQESIISNHSTSTTPTNESKDVWVFGYGALIWEPDFEFKESRIGYIEGYSRRFWQGNDEHRGTPNKVGRVATLVKEPDAQTWGRAFLVHDNGQSLKKLEHRLQVLGGYTSTTAQFHSSGTRANSKPIDVLIFIALPSNPLYLGPAPLGICACDIVDAHGSAGHNVEYLAKLVAFMKVYCPNVNDEHLFTLENFVMRKIKSKYPHLERYFEAAILESFSNILELADTFAEDEEEDEPVAELENENSRGKRKTRNTIRPVQNTMEKKGMKKSMSLNLVTLPGVQRALKAIA